MFKSKVCIIPLSLCIGIFESKVLSTLQLRPVVFNLIRTAGIVIHFIVKQQKSVLRDVNVDIGFRLQ